MNHESAAVAVDIVSEQVESCLNFFDLKLGLSDLAQSKTSVDFNVLEEQERLTPEEKKIFSLFYGRNDLLSELSNHLKDRAISLKVARRVSKGCTEFGLIFTFTPQASC